jgi:hypothetical protein
MTTGDRFITIMLLVVDLFLPDFLIKAVVDDSLADQPCRCEGHSM